MEDEWSLAEKIKLALITAGVVGGAFFLGFGMREKGLDEKARIAMPKAAYSVPDLNQDSIDDFVIERNDSHKYPLFGIREGDKLIYLPASEMEERQKDAVIKVDYERIEDLLNKQ
ncbi:MAG: hypothetical protein QME12_03910 [Nanoarchaeota archaeon]|nr:hypothetical protein [Nanoarchaeota archaeon]